MSTLLKSLLVSKMEYACVVWAPTDRKHINLIEDVQRKFTSRYSCFNTYSEELGKPICTVDYWDRLKELQIFSLERRRERYMILYIYKIIIGLCPNPGFERIPYNNRTFYTVTPKQNRKAEKWVQKLRSTSFFNVAPTLFNSLPLHLRDIKIPDTPTKDHVDEYKTELDKYLWHIPDQPGTVKNQQRLADSNSLIHQKAYYMKQSHKLSRSNRKNEPNSLTVESEQYAPERTRPTAIAEE